MRPEACPRCARRSNTWTFERDQGLAGCPCGEVIAIDFDDESIPGDPLSKTSKKPRRWAEDARPDGFTATLNPTLRQFWFWAALPFMLLVVPRGILVGGALGGLIGFAVAAAAMSAFLGWVAYQAGRKWTFAIEAGHFRAEARGHRTDIPLEDVQRFAAVAVSTKRRRLTRDARATFDLVVVRTNGERVRVPLFVEGPEEAQFIAERANALLATDGRTIVGDYRGQHVRVGDTDPHTRVEDELAVTDERVEVALDPRDDVDTPSPLRRRR